MAFLSVSPLPSVSDADAGWLCCLFCLVVSLVCQTSHYVARTAEGRHLATGQELLRVSERSIDAAQDRLVLRRALDGARQIQVDRSSVL